NSDLVAASDWIILAVKPKDVGSVAEEIYSHLSSKKVLVSIAAGVSVARLRKLFGERVRILRAMPNTPSQLGLRVAGIFAGANMMASDEAIAAKVFSSVGESVFVESEEQLDWVTAVSASGPAYVYYFLEALIQAATTHGLSLEIARRLVFATVIGASQLAR